MATIQEIRLRRGMSQSGLAIKSGIALSSIQKYEAGQREPVASRLRAIAEALGVSMDELDMVRSTRREPSRSESDAPVELAKAS